MSEIAVTPKHIGIIIDGNRRWAQENDLSSNEGHRVGAQVFKKIALHGFDRGVKYISAYIFSNENWQRTEDEVGYLMQLVLKAVESYLDEFHSRGIKIVILGRKKGLRTKILKSIAKTEEKTKNNKRGTLALCFNYGGREEIVDAANSIIARGQEITTLSLNNNLYHKDIPDLDFIIRTSGEQRLSNFMLWRAGYAELFFTKKHWPTFTTSDFDKALLEFAVRKRRFGT